LITLEPAQKLMLQKNFLGEKVYVMIRED